MSSTTIMTSNRVAPWLGVGVSGEWNCSHDALAAAKMDFNVRQEKTYWMKPDSNTEGVIVYDNEQLPMYANVRCDTNTVLGCVTPQYQIVQNEDAFSLIDPFISNGGKITHAGMTADGLCFMVAEVIAEKEIGGEPYVINLMATNSFNTKYPCQIIMTPVRIYCQNMYRKLVNDRILLAKHTITIHDRVKQIANGNDIEKKVNTFTLAIETAQSKNMDLEKLRSLTALLFPYPKAGGPRELTFKAKADEARKEFENVYYDAPDNVIHHGTAFGFINAYYDYISHRDPVRQFQNWKDRRLSGIVSAIDINNIVLKEAMK